MVKRLSKVQKYRVSKKQQGCTPIYKYVPQEYHKQLLKILDSNANIKQIVDKFGEKKNST